MNLTDWLQIVIAGATFMLAIATSVLAWQTKRSVDGTNKLVNSERKRSAREEAQHAQLMPALTIADNDLDLSDPNPIVTVTNTGIQPAFDVVVWMTDSASNTFKGTPHEDTAKPGKTAIYTTNVNEPYPFWDEAIANVTEENRGSNWRYLTILWRGGKWSRVVWSSVVPIPTGRPAE